MSPNSFPAFFIVTSWPPSVALSWAWQISKRYGLFSGRGKFLVGVANFLMGVANI